MALFGKFARREAISAKPDALPTPAEGAVQGHSVGNREALERTVLELAASDDPRSIFVAAFGLNRFDRLRAVVGYSAITELMRQLTARLSSLQPEWRIGRISDDVLGAAFHAVDGAEAELQAHQARQAMQGTYVLGAHPIDVRLTAGLSLGGPPRALVREADVALDVARAEHANLRVFDPQAHARAIGSLSLMPELRAAIAADELFVVHQPKFDLRTCAVSGVETLVRWTHPTHGVVEPDEFVRLSEETADIYALTRWVLERALEDQKHLAGLGHPLQFAVNLSGRLVSDARFVDWILDRVRGSAGALRLEITETAVIEHPQQAFANIARLSAAGVPCSIDDFGAGLSSLAYLKRIEADELKLDKSIIDELASSNRDILVTRSIVDLAHSLGMKVVAEGVETVETAAVVVSLGCDLAQGYLFARPLPLAELVLLLDTETGQRSEMRRSG